MSDLHRWNDDRLDELSNTVRGLAERQFATGRSVDRHEAELKAIAKRGDRRSGRSWDVTLALIVVMATNLATVLITVLHH